VFVGFVQTFDDLKQKIADAWSVFSRQLSFAEHWIAEFLEGQKLL
jgi:hypothetical protein